MASLIHTLRIVVMMVLFKEKPQNLEASYRLVFYSAVALLFASSYLATLGEYAQHFKLATVQIIVSAAAVWVILLLARKATRWRQTITAIFGTTCLIRAISHIPIQLVWTSSAGDPAGATWAAMIAMPFGLWSLAVTVLIIKESLEISIFKGFMISFGLALFTSFVVLFIVGFENFQAEPL